MDQPFPAARLAAVDALLNELPELADRLLDLRLLLAGRGHAGRCVSLYFQLRQALPAWRRVILEPLGLLLEEEIQIQVAIADSLDQAVERARRCLGLEGANDLRGLCEGAMRQAARDFPEEARLQLRFGWVRA